MVRSLQVYLYYTHHPFPQHDPTTPTRYNPRPPAPPPGLFVVANRSAGAASLCLSGGSIEYNKKRRPDFFLSSEWAPLLDICYLFEPPPLSGFCLAGWVSNFLGS